MYSSILCLLSFVSPSFFDKQFSNPVVEPENSNCFGRKPVSINSPTVLRISRTVDGHDVPVDGRQLPSIKDTIKRCWFREMSKISEPWAEEIATSLEGKSRMRTFHYFSGLHKHSLRLSTAVGCLFGCLHCVAWNFHFPTIVELELWRAAAVTSTVMPLVIFLALMLGLFPTTSGHAWPFLNKIRDNNLVMGSFVTVYILSRLYIIIALFTSLRSQPEDIYAATNWLKYIPHFN